MRCSSSEPLLDAYVDDTLGPIQRARVAQHLATCSECSALLVELRVIDALLLRPRELEPAANFSFKVMAEIRSMPRPHVMRSQPLALLATYVVFAWSAIGAFLVLGGQAARAMVATLSGAFANFGSQLQALAIATGGLFGHHTFDVTAAMGALLALDLVAAAGVVALYAVLRGRRAAALANVERC